MADSNPKQAVANDDLVAVFGEGLAYRRAFQAGGRVHMDRPMPFLVLNRYPPDMPGIAHRIAQISPSSAVWPAKAEADAEALENLRHLLRHQNRTFPKFLLVVVYDLPVDATLDDESPRLEPFRFTLGASADAPAQAALQCLQSTLAENCIEQRKPDIDRVDYAFDGPVVANLLRTDEGLSKISIGLPQIHRVPGEERIYPEIFHELESRVFDALLKTFAAFMGATGSSAPAHHRALGRRSFVDAALTVDKELARISLSFDFLLGVSPINTDEAFERFVNGKCASNPDFRYRPLAISPDLAKRALYSLEIRTVEDPVLESLFREKQREIDQQLTMLQSRNTPAFRYASLLQYGGVEPALLDQARLLLGQINPGTGRPADCRIDCHAIKAAAEEMLARYQRTTPEFEARVVLRDDIAAGLMVSGQTMLISTSTLMPAFRLDALLQHEISVHLLTCINGSQQGLSIFGSGLAGYEGIQEGLGVFAEYAVNGLTLARLRLLAARVLVVHAMLDGATFIDCHRMLHVDHGFGSRSAFNISARIFRSGGLSKDAIYLRGLGQVFEHVAQGNDLAPFWHGKIALHHVPVIGELKSRGMLRDPVALPEFLHRAASRERIERIRGGGSFLDLVRSTAPC